MKQPSHGEAIEQKNHGKSGDAWLKFKYCQCCGFHAQLPGGSSVAWWKEHWHEDEFSPHAWTAYWLDRYCADLVQQAERAGADADADAATWKTEEDYDPYAYASVEAAYSEANRFDNELRAFVIEAGLLRLHDWDAAKLAHFSCMYAEHLKHSLRRVDRVALALHDLLEFVRWVRTQGCAFPRGVDAFRSLKDVPEAQLPVERALWLEWMTAVTGPHDAWSDFSSASIPA